MKARVVRSDISPDSPAPGRLPPTVVRLGWVSFLTDVSSEMILPLLPAFLTTLPGAPARALGWIEGIAETTSSVTKVLSGRWTDRARAKKPLVLLGYGLSSAARPLIGLAPTWPVVALIRFADRIGKGIRTAPRDTMIAAAAPVERRGAAFGLHRAFDNAGAVLGPLIAAGLVGMAGCSFRAVFLLAAVPAALSLLVLGLLVNERKKEETESGSNRESSEKVPEAAGALPRAPSQAERGDAGVAPFDASAHSSSTVSLRAKEEGTPPDASAPGSLPPRFWRVAGVVGFFALAVSSDTFILLRAKEVGMAVGALPLLWAYSNAIKSLFSTWGGGLSDRFGRRSLLLAAWGLYALCYASFAFVASVPALVVLVGIYSLYYSLSEGTERALVADLVPAAARGRAFGWLNGLTGLAALPASAGFGLVWQRFGSAAAFLTGAGIAAAAALALLLLVPSRR
jgi:MFS family permease